jgi:hypothetical membrane protein
VTARTRPGGTGRVRTHGWDDRAMLDKRLRWGGLAWLLTLQFFVAETIAQLRFGAAYSRADDVISDLGASYSGAAGLMNASFVLQGVLIAAGVLLLRPALPRAAGRLAAALLLVAAAGVLVVGVVPLDADGTVHAVGAVAYLGGSALGLLALAHVLRPRSEAVASAIAVLGVVATAMTVFFLAGITRFLGEGGTERGAAYALPVGLAIAGVLLLRGGAVQPAGPGRRELRAQERAARRAEDEAQAAERDAALQRYAAERADDVDADEDPWAPTPRRRD